MNIIETKNVEIAPGGLLASVRRGRPILLEVDVLDEKDFDDGEKVEVEFSNGEKAEGLVFNKCGGPNVHYNPFDQAFRHAYILAKLNGMAVEVRIAGLKARRL